MKMLVIAIAATTFAGCKKTEAPAPTMGSGSAVAAMTGSGSAVGSAAPKMLTGDDLVKRYHDCWTDWAAGKWDDLKTCYASDAAWEAPGSKMGPINGAAAIVELDKSFRAAFSNETAESQLVLV